MESVFYLISCGFSTGYLLGNRYPCLFRAYPEMGQFRFSTPARNRECC